MKYIIHVIEANETNGRLFRLACKRNLPFSRWQAGHEQVQFNTVSRSDRFRSDASRVTFLQDSLRSREPA